MCAYEWAGVCVCVCVCLGKGGGGTHEQCVGFAKVLFSRTRPHTRTHTHRNIYLGERFVSYVRVSNDSESIASDVAVRVCAKFARV